MPKTVGAENIQSVSISPTEEEEFYDYEFCFSVFVKAEFFIYMSSRMRKSSFAAASDTTGKNACSIIELQFGRMKG